MADTTRSLVPVIHAARTAGDRDALRAACRTYLAAAKTERAAWATPGASRFEILPLNTFDLAVVMLAGAGKEIGADLWRRHAAAKASLDSLDLLAFRDLVVTRLATEQFGTLPATPTPDGVVASEAALLSLVERLRDALDAFARRDLTAITTAASVIERSGDKLLAVAVRDLAQRRGLVA